MSNKYRVLYILLLGPLEYRAVNGELCYYSRLGKWVVSTKNEHLNNWWVE